MIGDLYVQTMYVSMLHVLGLGIGLSFSYRLSFIIIGLDRREPGFQLTPNTVMDMYRIVRYNTN